MMRTLILTLGFLALAATAAAQEETKMDFCAECHEDEAAAFAAGDHGSKMTPEQLQDSCAACHGPVDEHVEDPSPENIHRWPTPDRCATCHAGQVAGLRRTTPAHPRNDVACLDCHVPGHSPPAAKPLLAAEPRSLCGSCHADKRNAFELPYAHREGNEPFACTTCHAIHGEGESARWTMLGNGGGPCVACHTDMAGPFAFPHPPREVDGCVTCHEPHGSTNPRQLNRRTVFQICLECHTNVPLRAVHDFSQAQSRACQTCHRSLHGSNTDPRFLTD